MARAQVIDALLPQTQCTRCGYSGCLPYAQAIAAGTAEINQCPPGGEATIAALPRSSWASGRAALPLNPLYGTECAGTGRAHRRGSLYRLRQVPAAVSGGCDPWVLTRYLCHTRRAAGAAAPAASCIAPCPVDCIRMVPRALHQGALERTRRCVENRGRFAAHNERIAQRAAARTALWAERKHSVPPDTGA